MLGTCRKTVRFQIAGTLEPQQSLIPKFRILINWAWLGTLAASARSNTFAPPHSPQSGPFCRGKEASQQIEYAQLFSMASQVIR
ncbi:hypothetical protein LIA77_01526 [Sarocladium implicatum]|nr:hypothetical protein LIA77_01526 [Sarocladium implicatum]